MSLAEIVEQYKVYTKIATWLDFSIIGMNICIILILLLQAKKIDKKIKGSFLLYIIAIILILVAELVAWNTVYKPNFLIPYKVAIMVECFLTWVAPVTIFNLVKNIIEYKVKFNKTFVTVFFATFGCLGLLIFIPAFQKEIIVFDDEICVCGMKPMIYYYYLVEAILLLVGLGLGLKKSKQIGIRDTVVGAIFIAMPFISIYINAWWASTVGALFATFALLFLFSNTYLKRYEYVKDIEYKKQIELSETKTKLLLTQIQPHFLYNTLSTLKYLCETDPKEAGNLCDDFSNYLRANIDAVSDAGLVVFDKELKNIENYLKIEKARFEDRVQYRFAIEERDFVVPVLSIQTIVENAVKKGICKKMEGGTIVISTKNVRGYVEIKVVDDGAGFEMDKYMSDGKNHTGLTNTKQRLALINGTICVESEPNKGTTVTIRIPKGEEQ